MDRPRQNQSCFRSWTLAVSLLTAAGPIVTCGGTPPPPPPAPAPVVKTPAERVASYQECWRRYNEKAWDAFADCYSEGAVSDWVDSTPSSYSGRAAIIEHDKVFTTAFPDRRGELMLVLGNGARVASIALFTGTHEGPLPSPDGKPVPPTKKKIGFPIAHVIELDATGARGVRDAVYVEEMTMMAQLGLVKAPARKPMASSGTPPTVVIARNDDTETKNVAAFRAIADAVNKRDFKAFEAALADDYKLIEVAQPTDRDKKGALASMKEFIGGFADANMSIATIWGAGDYVAAAGSLEGTNTGNVPSMGLKKTGKKVNVRFYEICQFENGKVKTDWTFYNAAAFAAQLGMK